MSGGVVNYWSYSLRVASICPGGFAARIDTVGTTDGDLTLRFSLRHYRRPKVDVLNATGNTMIRGGNDRQPFLSRGWLRLKSAVGSVATISKWRRVIGALPDDPTREIVDGSGGHVTVRGGSIGKRMILRDAERSTTPAASIGDAFLALEGSRVNILRITLSCRWHRADLARW